MSTRFVFLLAALAAVAAAEAPSPPPVPLSLQQAIDLALAPDGATRLQLAREFVRQAEARAAQARSALLPDLDASASGQNQTRNLRAFGIQFESPFPGFEFPRLAGPFTVFDLRATATQTVFDIGAVRRLQAARAAASAARLEEESARNQVTDQVARVYLAGLRGQAAVEAAEANVELARALLRLAESQKAAGAGTGIEVTRARVQLSNEEQRLLVSRNQRARALLELKRLAGMPQDTPVELSDRLAYVPTDPVTVETAVATAARERAELRAQRRREESARLSLGAVKSERLPSIVAFGDYGTIGSGPADAIPTRAYGLALRLPVFDGGRRAARRAEAISALRVEELRTRDLARQVELDVRLALDSLESAEGQVKAAGEGLQLAENELAQARRRYQAGLTSSLEVTDAQTRLERARANHIDALFNYNLAQIDLTTALGGARYRATK